MKPLNEITKNHWNSSMHANPILLGIGQHPLLTKSQDWLKRLPNLNYLHFGSAEAALERIAEYTEDQAPLAVVMISDRLSDLSPTALIDPILTDHPACQMLLLTNQPDISTLGQSELAQMHPLQIVSYQNPLSFSHRLQNALYQFYTLSQLQNQLRHLEQQVTNLEEKLSQKTTELIKKNLDLQKLSTTDTLTQLPNRLKLDQYFSLQFKHCQRYHTPLTIMLLDLDHFKQVNDTHGHQVGDEVLIELAQRLSNNIRETALVGRWGGEEFLILCPELNQDHALTLAEKLRQLIEIQPFNIVGTQTASFGVATLKTHATEDSLLEAADKALYEAKKQGRNRIIHANNLL